MSDSGRVVSILGGTGVFGSRIAETLVRDGNCRLRIIGRDAKVGESLASRLGASFVACDLVDRAGIARALEESYLVIHAAGPFQDADYRVANLCLEAGAHYLDLADARAFVVGIGRLDEEAHRKGLLVASGASSAPATTWALVHDLLPNFARIDSIHIALSPGNQNPRGPSTIGAVLSYLGREITVWQDGQWAVQRGWSDGQVVQFPPPIGRRRVYNCDVPDLELFPALFGARTVRFSAGMELGVLNRLLSLCALAQRWWGFDLARRARWFWKLSRLASPFGTSCGGLAVWVRGQDHAGRTSERRIALVTDRDGPAIPIAPAILLVRKLLASGAPRIGAFPCVGMLTFEELRAHLEPLGVFCVGGDERGWDSGVDRS